MEKEYVIGVTGASGVVYAHRLLEVLCAKAKVHVVISALAHEIACHEGVDLEGFRAEYYGNEDMGAPIASGSFRYDRLAVVPCSMKTLAAISNGYAETLITRAADVALKERRRPVLLLREMPFSRVHLRNMLLADEAGATVMAASPPFYERPATIDDLVDMVVARILDHLEVEHAIGKRWSGYDR